MTSRLGCYLSKHFNQSRFLTKDAQPLDLQAVLRYGLACGLAVPKALLQPVDPALCPLRLVSILVYFPAPV